MKTASVACARWVMLAVLDKMLAVLDKMLDSNSTGRLSITIARFMDVCQHRVFKQEHLVL
jgi:hypothetical protein